MGNVLKDLGNFIADPGKQLNNASKGLGIDNALHTLEQGISGGEGWGGAGKNLAAVVAAPFTGGTSLAGSQWADNALKGNAMFEKQDAADAQSKIAQPTAQTQAVPEVTQPPVDILHEIEQGISGGKGIGGALENTAGAIGGAIADPNLQNLAGNYLGSQATADVAKRGQDLTAKAYQEMMGRSKEGEGQFLGALNEPNPAMSAYAKDIQDMGQQNIGRQQNIINQQLGRAGVKGGQAANLYGRQIGELQQGGQRDINKMAYEDAQNKANQKSQYFANKGQSGFNLVPKYS